jgi:3-isopropylmalate dehydrogenase
MGRITLATMLGDGIGPDIVSATIDVLREAGRRRGVQIDFDVLPCGLSALDTHGSTFPAETGEQLASYSGWILGPISQHLYPASDPRYVNPSGYLRKHRDLYANIRPAQSLPGVPCVRDDVDLVIVRENTEGFYADRNVLDGNGELRPTEDMVISVRVVTRQACTRLAHQAFALARERAGKRRVTAVHKANVLRRGDGLFLECCRDVARQYPDITLDDYHLDAFAMYLITRPQDFDVVATTNLYGDILSDEAAGLVGGLGLAPGLNAGDEHAMAQAVHGSAPDIAHLHVANPVAEILSGALLLEWLAGRLTMPELTQVARNVEEAVQRVLASGVALTPDLGGKATTAQLTRAIAEELRRSPGDGGHR